MQNEWEGKAAGPALPISPALVFMYMRARVLVRCWIYEFIFSRRSSSRMYPNRLQHKYFFVFHLSMAFPFVSRSMIKIYARIYCIRIRLSLKLSLIITKWIYKSHLCKSICEHYDIFYARVLCMWRTGVFFKFQKRDMWVQVEHVKCKWMWRCHQLSRVWGKTRW